MDKRTKNGPRRTKQIFRRRRQFVALLLVSIFFLVGSTTLKVFASLRPTAVGISTKETFNTMVLKNPVKLGLNEEIGKVEEEKVKAKIESIRAVEEKRKQAEEDAKRIEKEKVDNNRKIAYLTFDDGPSTKVTPRVLGILDDYDIKATFFVLGKMANANPEMLKRVHNDGHAIAHHSYSHDYKHLYKSTGNFIAELDKTNKLFKEILGEDFKTRLLRFPGGSFEKSKQKFIKATANLGYSNYDWNALNGDAEGHGLSKKTLVNKLKSTVESNRNKSETIILMHDTNAKATTADALPEIIDYLIKEGYEFRTLNQK